MKKYFVNYKQSLALKGLGFDMPCLMYIDVEEDLINDDTAEWIRAVKCPLKPQVFEWIRDNHKIESYIEKGWSLSNNSYEYRFNFCKSEEIGAWTQTGYWVEISTFKTYEEAESACIDKFIEIIKK